MCVGGGFNWKYGSLEQRYKLSLYMKVWTAVYTASAINITSSNVSLFQNTHSGDSRQTFYLLINVSKATIYTQTHATQIKTDLYTKRKYYRVTRIIYPWTKYHILSKFGFHNYIMENMIC